MRTLDLEAFLEACNNMMHEIGNPDLDFISKIYRDFYKIPKELSKHSSMMAVFVMVGVALARLGYDDSLIIEDINRLRELYAKSQPEGYDAAYELLEERFKEVMSRPRN